MPKHRATSRTASSRPVPPGQRARHRAAPTLFGFNRVKVIGSLSVLAVSAGVVAGGVVLNQPSTAPEPAAAVIAPVVPTVAPAPVLEPIEVAEPAVAVRRDTITRAFARPVAESLDEIPSPALVAYQRSAEIMNSASKKCHLSWPVLAAIGKVESDHGARFGATIDDEGFAKPAVYGKPFDGRNGRPKMRDTDAGRIDGNKRFDRPVGIMQIIPSSWSAIGVDADGDGKRDPQNVNDAALATAVYLCGNAERLDKPGPLKKVLRKYNSAPGYAKAVMTVAKVYSEPTTTVVDTPSAFEAETPTPPSTDPDVPETTPTPTPPADDKSTEKKKTKKKPKEGNGKPPKPTPAPTPSPKPTPTPTPEPKPTPTPTPEPTTPPTTEPSGE